MASPEATRFRATVHYDGTDFAGWQIQPDERTVQGEIERALHRLDIRGRLVGAGRTDAGVHASGQELAFDAPARWTEADLLRALGSLLPEDIWIEALRPAAPDFHPRLQATARRYEYYFATGAAGRTPFRRRTTAWLESAPAIAALRAVALTILGEHDFRGFSKSGQPDVRTVCTIERASWMPTALGDLRFTIVADRFLHHMVRYLVTTMVEQASGRRPAGDVVDLLRGRDDTARPPAPADARGLYLTGVRYRDGWNRGPGVPGLSVPIPLSGVKEWQGREAT